LPKLALRGELVGVGLPRRNPPAGLPSEFSDGRVDVEARSWSSMLVAADRARTCAASLVAEPPLAMALARNARDRRLSFALIVDKSDSVDALGCMAADAGATGLEEKSLAAWDKACSPLGWPAPMSELRRPLRGSEPELFDELSTCRSLAGDAVERDTMFTGLPLELRRAPRPLELFCAEKKPSTSDEARPLRSLVELNAGRDSAEEVRGSAPGERAPAEPEPDSELSRSP
jgi:hypothetical protein